MAIAAIATLAMFAVPAYADLNAAAAPAMNFALSHWELNLPVDSSGGTRGESISLTPAQLTAAPGYSSQWFFTGKDGSMSFWAPVNGATTSGSSYPRSELRELIDPTNDNINWMLSGTSILRAKCKVAQVPSSTGKVVIGQIHGFQAAPLVKMEYQYSASSKNGSVRVLINATPSATSPTSYTLSKNIALGQAFSYEIKVTNSSGTALLTMSVNDAAPVTYSINHQWDTIGMYFKAGDYVQANGSSSSDGGLVSFTRLEATHPNNGLKITTSVLPSATAGSYYRQSLLSTGGVGAATWSTVSGVLPAGLSLSANGVLSGTPALSKSTTTHYFTLLATDQQGDTATRSYGFTIGPAP